MRTLEIAVAIALLLYVVHLLSPSRGESIWFSLLPFITAVLVVCQLSLEGYRWQMAPAYCLSIFFVLYECTHWLWAFRAPYLVGAAALLLVFSAIGLSTVLPVFKLPASSGPFKTGTQIRHIVDESRQDSFSDYPSRVRELMIQIWYPVDPSVQGQVAPYRERTITSLKDAHFALVQSHSILGAQLSHSQSRYPVLLYAPSWSGIRTESTFQVKELASHGYVVVGIDHPYSSRITAFPDGRIAVRKFTGEEDYSSPSALEAFVNTADQQVAIRARDASFVLDTLERFNANDPVGLLTGRLDLDRAGIFGFSFGGTTAAEACWLDRRFKAGLDLDGMVAGQSGKQGTFAPFFFMFQDTTYSIETDLSGLDSSKRREIEFSRQQDAQMKRSLSKYGGYWMEISGTKHSDFSDFPFFSPLRYGNFDPERRARIISSYVLAFFDKYLRGIEQPLLDDQRPGIPEVRFQVWKAKGPAA